MTTIERNIIEVLGYFDLFQYPLFPTELQSFLLTPPSAEVLEQLLKRLMAAGLVFETDGVYGLSGDRERAKKRFDNNRRAKEQMPVAERAARWVARFPFVRAVAISGSLSKNVADSKTDVDLFVITARDRLWIARTCLHLYKKWTFIRGHQHRYCMNYFVDEAGMEIQEQNIFTAVELVTLLPVAGTAAMGAFASANRWTNQYFPAKPIATAPLSSATGSWWARLVETCCRGRVGNWLDDRLMRITAMRWARKTQKGQINSRGVLMSMLADPHFSKPDPANFQRVVLQRFTKRMQEMLTETMPES
jgi:hypothetical protein